jgi:cobalamin biosynthetic protein CobC
VQPEQPDRRPPPARIAARCRPQLKKRGGWLIVDEAFIDPTPEDSLTPLAGTDAAPNLIVLRSLGKFFGLAGARVGFIFAAADILSRMAGGDGPVGDQRPVARSRPAGPARHRLAGCRPRKRLGAAGERLHQLLAPLGEVKATALFATLCTSPHSRRTARVPGPPRPS